MTRERRRWRDAFNESTGKRSDWYPVHYCFDAGLHKMDMGDERQWSKGMKAIHELKWKCSQRADSLENDTDLN